MSNFGHISEDELLALVERRAIPAERRDAVMAALKNDPELAQLVRDLRGDCDLAKALRVASPAGMVEAVQARLEREALLGLSASEHAPAANDTIPISKYVPLRRSALDVVVASPWSRRMTTAAVIALVGVGAWVGVRSITPAKRTPGSVALNLNDKPKANDGVSHQPTTAIVNGELKPDANNTVKPGIETDLAVKPTTASGIEPDAATRVATIDGSIAARASEDAARTESQRLAAAMQAGLRGKLVIRVVAPTIGEQQPAAEIARMLDRLSTRPNVVGAEPRYVRLADADAPGVLTLVRNVHMRPVATPDPVSNDPASKPPERGVAGVNEHPAPAVLPQPANPDEGNAQASTPAPLELDASAYAVSINATESELRALIGRLGQRAGVKVELDVLVIPVSMNTPMDPAAMFWWKDRPAAWAPRMQVPIVIQTSR